jgi:hypothetical protein
MLESGAEAHQDRRAGMMRRRFDVWDKANSSDTGGPCIKFQLLCDLEIHSRSHLAFKGAKIELRSVPGREQLQAAIFSGNAGVILVSPGW